jgi:arylsulfatase A-like enzyme
MKTILYRGVTILSAVLLTVAAASSAQRPNIVIVLADDMGYGDLGCYNAESKIPTPNMDLLAREGIRFTDAHSASAVCTPSRYALLTGRYCWRTPLKYGVLFNYEPPLIEPGRMTIASLLKANGYTTAITGKWHLGLNFPTLPGRSIDFDDPLPWYPGPEPDRAVGESIDFSKPVSGGPEDLGFDRAFYTAGCATDQAPYCFIENRRFVGMKNAAYRRPERSIRYGMASPDWRNDLVDLKFADKAITFIEEAATREQPFFLYVPLSSPHSPHFVPKLAEGKSRAGWRGDMVWLVDSIVGRIVDALKEGGVAENTLLIVTSDNGPLAGSLKPGERESAARPDYGHKSAGDLRGFKAKIHEGGHRIPFIARWPGRIPAGVTSDELLGQNDLLATFAAIVGQDLPKDAGEDSFNVLTALRGGKLSADRRPPLIQHAGRAAFAIRDGNWKLILVKPRKPGVEPKWNPTGELYNLAQDPAETTNLWTKHPEKVEELTSALKRFESGEPSVNRRTR